MRASPGGSVYKSHTQIAYHSSVEDKETPLDACVNKMVREAPSLQYNAEQRIAANEGGFGFLAEMRDMSAEMAKMNNKDQETRISLPEPSGYLSKGHFHMGVRCA